MYWSSLPPPHPTLPQPFQQQAASSPSAMCQEYQGYHNSHYVQAYSVSNALPTHLPYNPVSHSDSKNRGINTNYTSTGSTRPLPVWYQAGSNRCTYSGCMFSGSRKTVEIHMMDRHLIYPPGWDKRNKNTDWDTDPSLKGKPIPIQGTNVILDTPEVIDAWIAERKRRFPTAANVEEKKRKMEEAVARGQLDITDNRRPNKRQKLQNPTSNRSQHSRGRMSADCRRGSPHKHKVPLPVRPRTANTKARVEQKKLDIEPTAIVFMPSPHSGSNTHSDSNHDDDDDEPEALSSKLQESLPLVKEPIQSITPAISSPEEHRNIKSNNIIRKKTLFHPKMPPHNPFASRPTLLRNLLLPEIRVTVSNLSQAVRFLVDNDFLHNVELIPGQAFEEVNKIQVVGLEESNKSSTSTS